MAEEEKENEDNKSINITVMDEETEEDEDQEDDDQEDSKFSIQSQDSKIEPLTSEYSEVIALINTQNQVINSIEIKLNEKCELSPHLKCKEPEIQYLHSCLEKENLKLQNLLERAAELQNGYNSQEKKTTEETDFPVRMLIDNNLKEILNYSNFMTKVAKKQEESNRKSDKEIEQEIQNFISFLMNQGSKNLDSLKKIIVDTFWNILQKKKDGNKNHTEQKKTKIVNSNFFNENLKYFENLLQLLNQKIVNQTHISQDALANDNSVLEFECIKLQEELDCRNQKIAALEKKFVCLQNCLLNLSNQNELKQSPSTSNYKRNKSVETLEIIRNDNMNLALLMDEMQYVINCLQNEIENLNNKRKQQQKINDNFEFHSCCRKNEIHNTATNNDRNISFKSRELSEIESAYKDLLADYLVKEAELFYYKKEFQQTETENSIPKNNNENNFYETEVKTLQKKIFDLWDEQENYKSIFFEQAGQLKDYQCKYQLANKTFEEQKCLLKKSEMQTERIENLINLEIQNIKNNFFEKLKDLAEVPKIIDNKRAKLILINQEIFDIEKKLSIMCNHYQKLKLKNIQEPSLKKNGNELLHEEKYKKAMEKLESLKITYDNLRKEHDNLNKNLQNILTETYSFRTEAAREVALIKEKAKHTEESIEKYIKEIEKEITECRKNTLNLIKEREEVINKMQKQLNILSCSFDKAQNQIETLKLRLQKFPISNKI